MSPLVPCEPAALHGWRWHAVPLRGIARLIRSSARTRCGNDCADRAPRYVPYDFVIA